MVARLRAQFIAGPAGRLFVVHHAPATPGECVILLPPFAEELNKCRRQIALQARALCAAGLGVVIADLRGTGDSDGELANADVEAWLDDLDAVLDWVAAEGYRRMIPWSVRAGALLAAPLLARRPGDFSRLVLWQPQASGKVLVNQFLRLNVVAGMMADAESAPTVQQMREKLEAGGIVEVAGYALGPALVASLDRLNVNDLAEHSGVAVDWFVRGREDASPSPAEARTQQVLTAAGVELKRHVFDGEPFWSTVEIATAPALIEATTALLAGAA